MVHCKIVDGGYTALKLRHIRALTIIATPGDGSFFFSCCELLDFYPGIMHLVHLHGMFT
jgi:hypothetical protein